MHVHSICAVDDEVQRALCAELGFKLGLGRDTLAVLDGSEVFVCVLVDGQQIIKRRLGS